MKRLVNGFFMVTSLVVIISMVISFSTVLEQIGPYGAIKLSDIMDLIVNSSFDQAIQIIATLGLAITMVFGFPVLIFLVSFNNLGD